MSALSEANTPAQDGPPPSIDTNQLQGQVQLTTDLQQQQNGQPNTQEPPPRKRMLFIEFSSQQPSSHNNMSAKAPSVRRACTACHAGKTRCSDVLPCQVCIHTCLFTPHSPDLPTQSCLKRGIGNTCAYPDPDADTNVPNQPPRASYHPLSLTTPIDMPPPPPAQAPAFAVPPPMPPYPPPMHPLQQHPQYYDYSNSFGNPTNSSFRPTKRPRPLTEEETAAIRNYTRGDFFVGSSAPVRIDPRLPVRLTLAEGDQVHFTIGGEGPFM